MLGDSNLRLMCWVVTCSTVALRWCRQHRLEGLLGLGDEELQDAWVLLEPQPEPEEGGEEQAADAPGAMVAAALAAPPAGVGWRTKRSAPAPLSQPAKRQLAAGRMGQ